MNRDPVIDWLLEEDNPPVRTLTLTRLLKVPEKDPEVQQATSHLMDYSVTQGILAHGEQFWQDGQPYAKYTGKYWQVIFLGQFLADGQDPRIAGGVRDLLTHREWVSKHGGQCLTANLLAAFRHLGYGTHPVVQEETEALAKRILADQGIACEAMGYSLLSQCYMALPKLLRCFAEGIPPEERSPAVRDAIEWIAGTLIANQVYVYVPGNRKAWQQVLARAPKRADLPPGETVKGWIAGQRERFLAEQGTGKREPKRGWLKFGFPLHYNSDLLEAMYALATAGVPMTASLEGPLQLIREKRTGDGVWILENSLNGKMWVDVEKTGKPSKWITYFALYVLDRFSAARGHASETH